MSGQNLDASTVIARWVRSEHTNVRNERSRRTPTKRCDKRYFTSIAHKIWKQNMPNVHSSSRLYTWPKQTNTSKANLTERSESIAPGVITWVVEVSSLQQKFSRMLSEERHSERLSKVRVEAATTKNERCHVILQKGPSNSVGMHPKDWYKSFHHKIHLQLLSLFYHTFFCDNFADLDGSLFMLGAFDCHTWQRERPTWAH